MSTIFRDLMSKTKKNNRKKILVSKTKKQNDIFSCFDHF